MTSRPGMIALFGSGETSPEGQRVQDFVLRQLGAPVRATILETPAGFEPNSDRVAGRLAEFLRVHLQNHRPDVAVVPARRRETPASPDNPAVVAPMYEANYLMLGPGSPSYAVRQLAGSLAWDVLLARHRRGAALVLASAAVIAAGALALPVYEIYKVGEDPHWKPGLDLFGPYGARLVLIPHWDNREGGAELDTSRCFMGVERFARLLELLPPDLTVVGVDEATALVVDVARDTCHVLGRGGVTICRDGEEWRIVGQDCCRPVDLGMSRRPEAAEGIRAAVWTQVLAAEAGEPEPLAPPADVVALANARAIARTDRDWSTADRLRAELARLGWQVLDRPSGSEIRPLSP